MNAALRRQQLLHEMGIGAQWILRASGTSDAVLTDVETKARVAVDTLASLTWDGLQAAALKRSGEFSPVLFGAGDQNADWLFIGLAPSVEDLVAEQPFTGDSGALLDNMLRAMDLQRGVNTYFTQLVKCGLGTDVGSDIDSDMAPTADQMVNWLPYLQRQITLMKPAIIVVFGHALGAALLQLDVALRQQSETQVYNYLSVPTIVTYAPDHLQQQPEHKRQAWHDLRLAMATRASQTV